MQYRMRFSVACLATLMCIQPALAEDPMLPFALGDLLGSEAACELTFDQTAIKLFVESKVPAGDLKFLGHVSGAASLMQHNIELMTQSQKTAHCTQARRLAQEYKLLADGGASVQLEAADAPTAFAPAEAASTETAPAQLATTEPVSTGSASAEAAIAETAPSETAPAESVSTEIALAEAAPAETLPAGTAAADSQATVELPSVMTVPSMSASGSADAPVAEQEVVAVATGSDPDRDIARAFVLNRKCPTTKINEDAFEMAAGKSSYKTGWQAKLALKQVVGDPARVVLAGLVDEAEICAAALAEFGEAGATIPGLLSPK